MTDHRSTLSDEELLSVLDGDADASLLDRLARDPAARARRDALAAAAALTAEPVPPLDQIVVDDLVARALVEVVDTPATEPDPGDGATGPREPSTPGATVAVLAPGRGRPAVPPWLVAAAVVALVVVGLGLVWSGRGEDTDDVAAVSRTEAGAGATTDGDSIEVADGVAEAAPENDGAEASPSTAGDAAGVPAAQPGIGAEAVYLGEWDRPEDLRGSLATDFPTSDAPGAPGAPKDEPTDANLARCAELMRVTLSFTDQATAQGWATVDGATAVVYEFGEADPVTVAGVGVDSCDPLFIFER